MQAHAKRGAAPAWRLLHTWDGEPGYQMALDEALLLSPDDQPVLRFYTWEPDALSLGYFQRWARIDERHHASTVVRRLTGGGAIHHANELTFSIAARLDHPLYRGPVGDSYARIHGILAHALADFGIEARLREERSVASDRSDTSMCFHESTPLDLIWDERKGVGSAQRRSGGRVLHHGSIKLGTTPLEGDVAQVWNHAGDLGPKELARRIMASFEELEGTGFEASEPTAAEHERGLERAAHFRSKAFLERR